MSKIDDVASKGSANECRDAVARLCEHLITKQHWSAAKMASRFNVPIVAIEEAMRKGISSELLHARVTCWIRESGEVPHDVPTTLLAGALAEDEADEELYRLDDTPSNEHTTEFGEGLDAATCDHLRFLQACVGHNFASIINDPSDTPDAPANDGWVGWIGSLWESSPTPSVPVSAESEEQSVRRRTLAMTPLIPKEHFAPFLAMYGPLFHANSLAHKPPNRHSLSQTASHSPDEAESVLFPATVPSEFRAPDFDVRLVLSSLSCDSAINDMQVIDLLCEQLAKHEDDVEILLMQHVRRRSSEFFEASLLYDALHSDTVAALDSIALTRREVTLRGKGIVNSFLSIARLYRRRRNLQRLLYWAETIERLVVQRGAQQEALSEHRNADAVVANSKGLEVLSTPGCTELRVLRNASQVFAEFRQNVVLVVLSHLESALQPASWDSVEGSAWDAIADSLQACSDLGCIGGALRQYLDAVVCGLRVTIQTTVEEFLASMQPTAFSNKAQQKVAQSPVSPATLLEQAAMLKSQYFIQLVSAVLDRTMEYTQQAKGHMEAVDTCLPAQCPDATRGWSAHKTALFNAVQFEIVGLLECRKGESASTMRFNEMEALLRVSFAFIPRLESALELTSGGAQAAQPDTAGKNSPAPQAPANPPPKQTLGSFRAALVTLARAFFKQHHNKQQDKMLMVLSQEMWEPQSAIEHVYQSYCDQLVDSSDATILSAKRASVMANDAAVSDASGALCSGQSAAASIERFESRMYLQGEGYVVGNSVLMLLQCLSEYDSYLCTFPFLANDIVSQVYDALKLYDGQCSALVLGAGAVDQGTLTAISTSHLALASQCMAFLGALIPLLQKRLERLSDDQRVSFLVTLDRVRKDVVEHRNEFYAKIVSMLRDRVASSNVDPSQWATHGNAWVLGMLKEGARMLKSLKPILNPPSLRAVCKPAFCFFAQRIKDALAHVPGMQGGLSSLDKDLRKRILDDVALFRLNLNKFGFSLIACIQTPAISAAVEVCGTSEDPATDADELVEKYFFGVSFTAPIATP